MARSQPEAPPLQIADSQEVWVSNLSGGLK
jgi:hypothetical protein